MMPAGQREADYCRRLVATYDPLAFRTAMFAPLDKRAGLLALYALCYEILRIPSMVREVTLGFIRVQWWREALHALRDTPPCETDTHHTIAHPVLQAMRPVFMQYGRTLFPAFDQALVQTDALMNAKEIFEGDQLTPYTQYLSGYADYMASLYLCDGQDIAPVEVILRAGGVLFEAQNFARMANRQYVRRKDSSDNGSTYLPDLVQRHDTIFTSSTQRKERIAVLRQSYEAVRAPLTGLDPVLMPAIVGFSRIPALLLCAVREQKPGFLQQAFHSIKERVGLVRAVATGHI